MSSYNNPYGSLPSFSWRLPGIDPWGVVHPPTFAPVVQRKKKNQKGIVHRWIN